MTSIAEQRVRYWGRASCAGLGFFALVSACGLDDRHLESSDPGNVGGSSDTARGGSGGTQSTNDAGTTNLGPAGASGESDQPAVPQPPIPTVDGCPDLDTDGVADCQQTKVLNPDFKSDVANWAAQAGATLSWASEDALSNADSGSALVSASGVVDAPGTSLVGASQCVPINGKQLVIVYANAFVDPGQDSAGTASLNLTFFDAAACTGAPGSGFTTPTPLDAAPGFWQTVQAGSLSADTTKSAKLTLSVAKPFRSPDFQARFDNVLLKELPAQ